MKLESSLGWLLKVLSFLAVLGILALSIAVLFYSFYDIYKVISNISNDYTQKDKIIADTLSAVDLILLGITIFLIGIGLFEIFITKIPNIPKWLEINDIDELKTMLIKVAIVIIGISFTGKIVTWDGESELLGYGIALGAVILALSYFLRAKEQDN